MKNDNLLDDLEGFLDGDWSEIHEEFKNDEYKKTIAEPVVPDFPNFKEFYELLVSLVGNPNVPPMLEFVIHRFTRNRERLATPAFENVWEFFADPRTYGTVETTCESCRRRFEVAYKKESIPRVSVDRWSQEVSHEWKSEVVACPNCGRPILHVAGRVVGIFMNGR